MFNHSKLHILLVVSLFSFITINAQQEPRELGFKFYNEENYEAAVKHLKEAVVLDKNDRSSWRYLGMAYLYLKNYKESRRAFSAADKVGKNATSFEPKATKNVKITKRMQAGHPNAGRTPFSTEPDNLPRDGVARLLVEFRKDGRIGMIHILSNTVPSWEKELIRAAREMKFEAAEKDGEAITVLNMVEYSYRS